MAPKYAEMTMAAMATTELKIGTGVCLALEHDILDLAKTVATFPIPVAIVPGQLSDDDIEAMA